MGGLGAKARSATKPLKRLRRRLEQPDRIFGRVSNRVMPYRSMLRRLILPNIRYVGVTGSAGKTTTARLIGAVLSTDGPCFVGAGYEGFGTTTPDLIFPSTACLVQHRLWANDCAAFDVNAACSGFVYALGVANAFMRSGQSKKALVIGAVAGGIADRTTKPWRWVAGICAVGMVSGLLVTSSYHRDTLRNGGSVAWTEAFYPAFKYVRDAKPKELFVVEWGFFDNLRAFGKGRLPLSVANDPAAGDDPPLCPRRRLRRRRVVLPVHPPGRVGMA